MITESLLQFIWQHSLFHPAGLVTTKGESLTIISPGQLNTDAGPDFREGRIRVGDTVLVGNIELHLKSSDWIRHNHPMDAAYHNVILHVILEDDAPEIANAPTLILKDSIPAHILSRYQSLIRSEAQLPCAGQLRQVRDLIRENWLNRLLAERWEQKLSEWNVLLANAVEDWRNLLYWRLAANFGFKVNSDAFLQLARSIPLNVLSRHKDNLLQLEAILFGQSGLLTADTNGEYPEQLFSEYTYLRKKYSLQPLSGHIWKFLRMRPANFPTIRIAQFADLIHRSEHLFSKVIEIGSFAEIAPLFKVVASSYWDTHFHFTETHDKPTPKRLGKASVENIVINTIAPIQFFYASRQGAEHMKETSLDLLESIPPEKNRITDYWAEVGWAPQNAGTSQALIQLYSQYCSNHRCLHCAIGLEIIKTK